MASGDLDDTGEHRLHLGFRALDLDDQQRLDIHRIAGLREGLADLDGGLVHELDGDGNDARADDIGDAGPRLFRTVEAEEHRARALGFGDEAHRRLRDDAELALAAANDAEQVQPPGIERLAAKLDDRAVDEHQLDAEQVVGRHAVFQAVRAAGIHADIAADGAGELGTRVRRVEIAVGGYGIGNRKIGDAGLDGRRAVGVIDLQDARHLGKADDDRVLLRDRAAGKRGARPARHDGHAVAMTVFQHRRDLFRRLRQGDGERQAAIGDEGVSLEGHQLARLMHEAAFRQEVEEIDNDFPAAGKHRGARLQEPDLIHILASPAFSTHNTGCKSTMPFFGHMQSGLFFLPLPITRRKC